MSQIKLAQEYNDKSISEDYQVTQSISIDLKEEWVYLKHNGEEFSMSLKSYISFMELNSNAIEKLEEVLNEKQK